jgi:hypothetical protein
MVVLIFLIHLFALGTFADLKKEITATIDPFLLHPWKTMASQGVGESHRIIVLSNLAEVSMNARRSGVLDSAAAKNYLEKLAAFATAAPGTDLAKLDTQDPIYLSHCNIVLGAYKRGTGSDRYKEQNRRISEFLANRSAADPFFHPPSFRNQPYRWPADQAATLYSLWLYDRNFGTTFSKIPIDRWMTFIKKKGTSKKWGLPISEVTGKASYSPLPRGCALSWTVRYQHFFAPREADSLWNLYKKVFMVQLPFACGFREYPPGVDRKPDDDSGPIVLGIGVAASGIALGAAKTMGDVSTYSRLKTAGATASLFGGAGTKQAGASVVAKSLELYAETFTEWK